MKKKTFVLIAVVLGVALIGLGTLLYLDVRMKDQREAVASPYIE